MVDRELQTEEQNLEASVSFLRGETLREADLLSEILAEKKAAETQARAAERRASTALARLEEVKTVHEDEKAARKALRDSRSQERAEHASQLALLQGEIRNAKAAFQDVQTDLDALISQKSVLLSELVVLAAQIADRTRTIEDSERLNAELAALTAHRDQILSEVSDFESSHRERLATAQAEFAQLAALAEEQRAATAEAETKKRAFDDEYQRKKDDLATAVDRIEAKYQEAFPGLRLLLT